MNISSPLFVISTGNYLHYKQMKIIIIGGVAGGATTAARIRRVDETAEIILLEKGKYISYANCGLPYYIGGVIEERDKLFVQTPEAFSTRFRVDVRTENEAIFIDRKRKTVTIRQSSEDTYEESYDKLVISTGASPVRPPLPGINLSGIFTLRNVTDTDRIKEYIKSHAPRKAVIVGAGFIGLEMAENLHTQGAKVSIVEMGNQVMAPIDFSMASLVHQHLMDKGVNLYLEQAVASFSREGKGLKVTFKNGQSISADIVILSIGVRPETSLARAAELTIGPAGGIAVNDYLQTSDESIYAIGDGIEVRRCPTRFPPSDHRKTLAQLSCRTCQPSGTHRCRQRSRGKNTLRRFYRHFNRKSFRHDRCFNRFTRQAPAPGRDRLYVIYHPSRLSCRLLSGCHADEYQNHFRQKDGKIVRRANRRLRRSGQTD